MDPEQLSGVIIRALRAQREEIAAAIVETHNAHKPRASGENYNEEKSFTLNVLRTLAVTLDDGICADAYGMLFKEPVYPEHTHEEHGW